MVTPLTIITICTEELVREAENRGIKVGERWIKALMDRPNKIKLSAEYGMKIDKKNCTKVLK